MDRKLQPLLIIGGGIAAWIIYSMSKNSAQAAQAAQVAAANQAAAAAAASNPLAPVSLAPVSLIPPSTASVELPASNAPTSAEAVNSGSFWSNLTPMPTGALGQSGGYVNFQLPGGSVTQAAASLLPYAVDSGGNIYTQWAGQVYLIGAQDAAGNFNATSVG